MMEKGSSQSSTQTRFLFWCWCSAAPRAGERRRVCAWSCQNARNKTLGVFRQLSGNRRRICKSENRKGTNTLKHQTHLCFFSYHARLLIQQTTPLRSDLVCYVSLAEVQVLQSAREVWGTGLFFRPQHCRREERPHNMCFLSRQQI